MKNFCKTILLLFICIIYSISTLDAQTTVCQGDTVILIVDNPTGTIQWQQSANQVNWTDIAGETNDTLRTAVANLFYRAYIHDTLCSHQYNYYSDTLNFNFINYLPVSLTIAASVTSTIYSGDSVTFTAMPVNGGTSPAYQWKKNGVIIPGEILSTYTTTLLSNGDTINCVLFSNFPCATGNPAVSNKIAINVIPSCGTVNDIDGNIYHTVQIGTQCWMVENLKTTRYRNGYLIQNVTDSIDWMNLSTGAYCNYNNDVNHAAVYGCLYNWYAVSDSRNIAPVGWHVPTDDEWTILTNYLGGENVSGGKLKEAGTAHWYSPNTGATNETGFTALPGGYRLLGTFYYIGNYGFWWSSTEVVSTTQAWRRIMTNNSSGVDRANYDKGSGYSVRCIKD